MAENDAPDADNVETETDSTEQRPEVQAATRESTRPEIDWKAKAREWESRAKANSTAAQRLQEIEDRDKTDLQRAQQRAEQAEARAAQALRDSGARLVRSQFDVLAARRNPDAKTADILEYVDLARLVDDNGEPDMKALQAAVIRLVPEATGAAPALSLDGGARKSPPTGGDMETLLRTAAGRA
jgi:ABC-type taurine transport system substrate-binding protein